MLLVPDKEHKEVFFGVAIALFHNSKSLTDYLVRVVLPKTSETGRSLKKTCLVCNSWIATKTFTTKTCWETFKIQKVFLNCDFGKLLYLDCTKICGEAPYRENLI